MRKRIAVIVGEADCEYAMELIPYLYEEAAGHDLDVVVFGNYGTYDKNLTLYSDGEQSVINIPDIASFAGVVVEESRLNIPGMAEHLYEHLSQYTDRVPIVYLKAVRECCFGVLASDRHAIRMMTSHFINQHGFRRIFHMAGRTDLEDAHERERGYREAMEEAGLPVGEHMVYWGDYWYNKADEALEFFLQEDGEYPEAIVCANDYMAIAILRELKRRGKRVPEDICVSGYDNIDDSKLVEPALTTVEVPKKEMARIAVDTIVRYHTGEKLPAVQYAENGFAAHMRDSCGCGVFDGHQNLARKIRYMEYHSYGMDMGVCLENGLQTALDMDEIYSVVDAYFRYNRAAVGFLCLCEDAIRGARRAIDRMDVYTDRMLLKRVFYLDEERNYDSPDLTFDRRQLLPDVYFESEKPLLSFVYPIHLLNHAFGYLVLRYEEDNWPNKYTQAYTHAIGNAIDDYNIRSEYMDMDVIRQIYLMDELTKLSNRRGYEQNLQTAMDRVRRRKLTMTLVSIDLDDLKTINDNYGHAEGDYAIVQVAEAIRGCLQEGESAARYGGDEFAVILLADHKGRGEVFEEKLRDRIREADAHSEKPYPIHASIGCCEVRRVQEDMTKIMRKADERMYEQKRSYKSLHTGGMKEPVPTDR